MSRAYDDSRYLARTLAVTLLDLTLPQRNEILRYLQEELERVAHVQNEPELDKGEAETQTWIAVSEEGGTSGNCKRLQA